MTKLPPEELEDFKLRYQNAFDLRLTDEEAYELMHRLLELYRTIRRRSASVGAGESEAEPEDANEPPIP